MVDDDEMGDRMRPELDHIRADHERFLQLVAQAGEPSEEQKRLIRKANSPAGWQKAMDSVLSETGLQPKSQLRKKGGAMRTFGIWVFGLLACAIIGGMIGSKLEIGYGNDSASWGALAGMFAFACARLWVGQRPGN